MEDLPLHKRAISGAGHVPSKHDLALLPEDGAEKAEQDAARAISLYERAISKGSHVPAMYNLALPLEKGAEGVQQDVVRAVPLRERANRGMGNVPVMHNLHGTKRRAPRATCADGAQKDIRRDMSMRERAIPESGDAKKSLIEPRTEVLTEDRESATELAMSNFSFSKGWRRDLVEFIIPTREDGEYGTDDPDDLKSQILRAIHITEDNARAPAIFSALGVGNADELKEAEQADVKRLFSALYKTTSWNEIEGMEEGESIIFLDFLQVLDGVSNGQVTNCLLDTERTGTLEAATVVVNAPESLVKQLGVRFIGPDVYADYQGYLKCIVYFEPRQGNGLPLIHLDGPWKRYQQHGKSVLHQLSAVEVGGVRRVSAVVDEMTKKVRQARQRYNHGEKNLPLSSLQVL